MRSTALTSHDGSAARRSALRLAFALLLAAAATVPTLHALGPLNGNGTQPARYAANKFPLVYLSDLGALGTFTNAQATAIATFSFGEWDALTTAALSFSNAGKLDHDVTSGTDPLITGLAQYQDGIIPVVFDNTGAITNAKLGAGASNQVYGFAASFAPDGLNYDEGSVVLNGVLTSRPDAEAVYKEVVTHEIGHMLGIGHSQLGIRANFSLMYPTTLSDVANLGIDPDDAASMSLLYPAGGYLASVGSISGTIRGSNNEILSGVNVVAVNAATGAAYSTVSDYFSGDDPLFVNKPARSGAFTIQGLPPGSYHVRIEPIRSFFATGSRVASYLTPINGGITTEWYNGANEGPNILLDDANEKTAVAVTAGAVTGGIIISANGSPTVSTLTEYNGTIGQFIDLPVTVSNVTFDRYAVLYTAPTNGSLVGVNLFIGDDSQMPSGSELKVTVYETRGGSLAGIPGTVVGSVSVPFSDLEADQENTIWLRSIGTPINFLQGEDFHVGIEVVGLGSLLCHFDNAVGTENKTSYHVLGGGAVWQNFPDGLTGALGWNLRMSALYSTVPAGIPTPLIAFTPTTLPFGFQRIGRKVTRDLAIQNTGTADLNVTTTQIAGGGVDNFTIESGGGAFTLTPGQTRTITIGFTADERPQTTAILNLGHNAAGGASQIELSGSGKEPGIGNEADELDFGAQAPNTSRQEDFVVFKNSGTDSLRITGVEIVGQSPSDVYSLRSFNGPSWVPPGLSFTARISFRPVDERTYSGTLRVSHELGGSPLEIPITGNGDDGQVGAVTELVSGALRLALRGVTPQPLSAEGIVTLEASGSGPLPVELLLVDLRGRTVWQSAETIELDGAATTVSMPIDVSALPSGVYHVVVRTEAGTMVMGVTVRR